VAGSGPVLPAGGLRLGRRLAVGVDELEAEAVGVAQVDGQAASGLDIVWRVGAGHASGLQSLVCGVGVVDGEGDVVDAGILLAFDLVDLEDRLVLAGQLQFGRAAVVRRAGDDLEAKRLQEGDVFLGVADDDLDMVDPVDHCAPSPESAARPLSIARRRSQSARSSAYSTSLVPSQ